MKNKLFFFECIVILLCGCSSSNDANNALKERYLGENADSFFMNYGIPEASYKLSNGDKIYRWNSGVSKMQMPDNYSVSGNSVPVGFTANIVDNGGYDISIGCKVDITANAENNIISIAVRSDSLGYWETSRCHEIFK